MKKEVGGIAAAIVIIIVLVTIILLGPWTGVQNPYYNPEESLPHLAAPAEIPSDQVNATIVGNLSMSVTGVFHTMSPHYSPSTFSFIIDVNVNNTGLSTIDDFHVVKVTMFYENATPAYTFGVEPDGNFSIADNSTWVREFQNDRDMLTIPSDFMLSGYTFARVLVTFDNDTEAILTTPLTIFPHAIE